MAPFLKFLFFLTLSFIFSFALPSSFENLTPTNENGGKNWALLVAGSNTYSNYRHQADICHAYQVLKANGFTDSQIVVMMYDDIAYNSQNPTPGVIINRPNGADVYHGVPKDYTGSQVTADNFYKVLQGLPTNVGSQKVINSGSNDNIFLFYSDHGSVGLICMPYGPYVYATDLSVVLKDMASQKKFNKFLIYVEACESGSMFYNGYLPQNVSIFATTASTPYQSSYACYYDSLRQAYLGDCYSVNWMEYTDSINVNSVSVKQEFDYVKQKTTGSTACAYGDTKLESDMLSVYMKGSNATFVPQTTSLPDGEEGERMSQRTIEEGILKQRYANAQTAREKGAIAMELVKLEHQRKESISFFYKFAGEALVNHKDKLPEFAKIAPQIMDVTQREKAVAADSCGPDSVGQMVFENFECYKSVTERVREVCGPLDSFSLQFTPLFASLCQLTENDSEAFAQAVEKLCPEPIWF